LFSRRHRSPRCACSIPNAEPEAIPAKRPYRRRRRFSDGELPSHHGHAAYVARASERAGDVQTFTVTTPPIDNCFDPDCTVCAVVDTLNAIAESNETNNNCARPLKAESTSGEPVSWLPRPFGLGPNGGRTVPRQHPVCGAKPQVNRRRPPAGVTATSPSTDICARARRREKAGAPARRPSIRGGLIEACPALANLCPSELWSRHDR
jgi:hypothetical protein